MEPILVDLRVALRRLRRAPGFTLFAVLSLAVGIGVSTDLLPTIFVCAAIVASWLPAARASRVDPNVALRDL